MLRNKRQFILGIKYMVLCAAAWLIVAGAYPFYGIFWLWHRNRPSTLTKTQTPDNCKLSIVSLIFIFNHSKIM